MEHHMSRNPVQIASFDMHESQLPTPAANQALREDTNRSAGDHGLAGAVRFVRSSGRVWMLALVALLSLAMGAQAQNGVFATPQPVGATASAISVQVTAQVADTVAAVQVLTLGVPNLEFAAGDGPSCPMAPIAAGASCTQSVTFTPAYPGQRMGAVVLLNSTGQVLGTAYLSGVGQGGLGVLASGNVYSVAGVYRTWNSTQDGILATLANLRQPASVALDAVGTMYIADSAHNRIRKVAVPVAPAFAGIISTYAGTGDSGYSDIPTAAVSATLTTPAGVALDGAGNLYIADTGNNVVRKVTKATGIISTVAGNGTGGFAGDGAAAISAELNQPWGVTVDGSGNLYIADTTNQRIRKVDALTGIITTVAGNGALSGLGDGKGTYSGDGGQATSAGLSVPFAVAFDTAGNIYIPDSANNRIRKVTKATGVITTVAGTGSNGYRGDGGAATAAFLYSPSGVALDPAGNIYIADTQNAAIRKVSSPASPTPGIIATIAVNEAGTSLSPGGTGQLVNMFAPMGLCLDGDGNLYIADYYDMFILEMRSNQSVLNYTATPVRQGDKSLPQKQVVENDGNAPLDLTVITHDANAALDGTTTTCTPGTPYLAEAASCVIGAVFAPSVAGNPLTGNIDVGQLGDTANAPLDIQLVGNATLVNSTAVVVSSNNNPSVYGQSVTFTAALATGASTGNLTGTVSFFDGATTLATAVPLNAPGTTATAVFATTKLAVGLHTITASYSGDKTHFAATSTDNSALPLIQTVNEATATKLTTSGSPSVLGANVTFTAAVTAPGGGGIVPDGTVTFSDGATILGNVALNASGVATFQTAALSAGLHSITAVYGGDAAIQILGSTSNALSQDVQASSTIAVTSNGSPSVYGTPVTFTAIVTPGGTAAATGLVKLLDGAKQIGQASLVGATGETTFIIPSLTVGSHTITAAYQGDSNYGASISSAITQQVNQAQTLTTVVATPNPGIAGKAVAIRATVQVIVGAATTTGTVTFTDGATTLGTAALGGSGTATINPILAPGLHSIVATYGGDINDATSASAAYPLTVILATTQTVVTATPTTALVLAPITFTAKVSGNGGLPTGSVSFLSDGAPLGTANLDATGTATFTTSGLAAGSHAIVASYSGDANDLPSASASITETVGKIATVTDLGTSSTTGANPQVILVAAVLGSSGPTPTGTVTFTTGSTVLGISTLDSSGVATLTPELSSGVYSIVAAYSGDAQHSPSTSQAIQVSTVATGFDLIVTPASVTMATTKNATVNVALTSISGFTDTIGLGCASLPAGITCHFSSINAVLAANGVQHVQLTIDTNNPLGGGATAMNSHAGNPGAYLAGLLLPFSVFFGWSLWRFRKRHATVLGTVLLLLLSGAALLATGCGGVTSSSAAPGTYVIQVTGTGANSDVIHYQNVTLTITK
jgi:sugar lactone lactonase YvrE